MLLIMSHSIFKTFKKKIRKLKTSDNNLGISDKWAVDVLCGRMNYRLVCFMIKRICESTSGIYLKNNITLLHKITYSCSYNHNFVQNVMTKNIIRTKIWMFFFLLLYIIFYYICEFEYVKFESTWTNIIDWILITLFWTISNYHDRIISFYRRFDYLGLLF